MIEALAVCAVLSAGAGMLYSALNPLARIVQRTQRWQEELHRDGAIVAGLQELYERGNGTITEMDFAQWRAACQPAWALQSMRMRRYGDTYLFEWRAEEKIFHAILPRPECLPQSWEER